MNVLVGSKPSGFHKTAGHVLEQQVNFSTESATHESRFDEKFKEGQRGTRHLLDLGALDKTLEKVLHRANSMINDIVVTIKLQDCVLTTNLKVSKGELAFDEHTKLLTWKIGSLNPKSLQLNPKLDGKIVYSYDAGKRYEMLACNVSFSTETKLPSGMSVNRLEVLNVNYKPFKGVKTKVISGNVSYRF